jgi:hypothetical protein
MVMLNTFAVVLAMLWLALTVSTYRRRLEPHHRGAAMARRQAAGLQRAAYASRSGARIPDQRPMLAAPVALR